MSEASETSEVPEAIGDLVREFRKREKLSQSDLAKAAGVSDGMIGNVERGSRNLGAETVERVAQALGLTENEHRQLLDARKRFSGPSNAQSGDEAPAWARQLLEEQRQITRALERLADQLEADDPGPR